jgi:sugar lactone lactonase YvrE
VDGDNSRVLIWASLPARNGQAADFVLGQPNFSSTDCNTNGPHAGTLCNPTGVAVSPSGRVFVADADNNRVLSWPAVAGSSQAADLIIGQVDGASIECVDPPSAESLCSPNGVATDGVGHLYVADANNNRVLSYDVP